MGRPRGSGRRTWQPRTASPWRDRRSSRPRAHTCRVPPEPHPRRPASPWPHWPPRTGHPTLLTHTASTRSPVRGGVYLLSVCLPLPALTAHSPSSPPALLAAPALWATCAESRTRTIGLHRPIPRLGVWVPWVSPARRGRSPARCGARGAGRRQPRWDTCTPRSDSWTAGSSPAREGEALGNTPQHSTRRKTGDAQSEDSRMSSAALLRFSLAPGLHAHGGLPELRQRG